MQMPLNIAPSTSSAEQQNNQIRPLSQPTLRLVLYAQTHHHPNGEPVSLLPLITTHTGVTHVIIAAVHINHRPENITLNDHRPGHPRNERLWAEVGWLRGAGVKVMMMLGGAAQGSYRRLAGTEQEFEAYYQPLLDIIRRYSIDGLDLDVEEQVHLDCILRLLRRLRSDLGPGFILTLAPVATALLEPLYPTYAPFPLTPIPGHLSGFSYAALEREAGHLISWYNTQFYNGWGDAGSTAWYRTVASRGWPTRKVVLGVLTNARHGGSGFVPLRRLSNVLRALRVRYGDDFGGIMGWEYWSSDGRVADKAVDRTLIALNEDDLDRPWHWARTAGLTLRGLRLPDVVDGGDGIEAPNVEEGPVGPGLVPPTVPWPEKDVAFLMDMGVAREHVVAAMNMTSGDVDAAAAILFDG